MKIAFLNPSAQLGGAERMLLDFIASLRESVPDRLELHLIALAHGPLIDAARSLGVNVIVEPMPASMRTLGERATWKELIIAGVESLDLIARLRRRIAELAPDVIHSNGAKTHILSRFLVGACPRAKLIWHVHDLLAERQSLGKLLRRFASPVSCAIAVSAAVEREIRIALPTTPVQTILNAIDIEHFSPGEANTKSFDRLAGFAHREDFIRIGLVSTFARWKGHDVFLEAAAKVLMSPDRPSMRFYIVGGPIYSTSGSQFSRAELSNRINELGIVDHIGFVDFQNDPREAYRALDIVVHASTRPEPFGRTIVEAMACVRAVIVSRGGGADELFTSGRDACGVPAGNADELAAAMLTLAADAHLRKALGAEARHTAVMRFDRRRLGPQLMALYRGN